MHAGALYLLQTMVNLPSERLSAVASHLESNDEPINIAEAEYDYVIIGGGTAGCVLADRLSQDSGVNVAVIEGGPSDERDDRCVGANERAQPAPLARTARQRA